jgi:hypothetical protein
LTQLWRWDYSRIIADDIRGAEALQPFQKTLFPNVSNE